METTNSAPGDGEADFPTRQKRTEEEITATKFWKLEEGRGTHGNHSEDKRKLKAKLGACVPQTMLIGTAEPQELRGWIHLGTLKVRFM